MISPTELIVLREKNPLLESLNTIEIEHLIESMDQFELRKTSYLFHKGMPVNHIYIVKDGLISILENNFEIATITTGGFIGEIGFIDQEPRSASAQAKQDSIIYGIDIKKLENHPALYQKIQLILSKIIAKRLRNINETAVNAMKNELQSTKLQVETGRFISYMLAAMALYVMSLRLIVSFLGDDLLTNYNLSVRVNIILVLIILFIIRKSSYSLSSYGINLNKWSIALFEGIIFSLPIIIITGLVKIRTSTLFVENGMTLNLLIGYLLFAPLEEFIARGCLQESLQRFLLGNKAKLFAIVIASLLYSSTYSYLSPITPAIMTLLGFFWGWLYSRQRTLIGVSASHILIGSWLSWIGFTVHLI